MDEMSEFAVLGEVSADVAHHDAARWVSLSLARSEVHAGVVTPPFWTFASRACSGSS